MAKKHSRLIKIHIFFHISQYVEDVTYEELIEKAIDGMLTGLDPHSGYMDEEVWGAAKSRGPAKEAKSRRGVAEEAEQVH